MLTELEEAFNIDEMCETEHFSPQPGTAWKFEHNPVTSSPVVSFTNITIAETPTLNQPRLNNILRTKPVFITKCDFSYNLFKTSLIKACIKHKWAISTYAYNGVEQRIVKNLDSSIRIEFTSECWQFYM